jgi:phenylpropionate dioxygenase-like ring-hydroxylating dioxygenase large terminal subunit
MHSLADDPSVVQRILDHIDNRTTDRGAEGWHEAVENYRSEARFAAEIAQVLRRTPTPFCPSAALPDAGSYVARNAAGVPLIAVRDRDGVARVFRNALPAPRDAARRRHRLQARSRLPLSRLDLRPRRAPARRAARRRFSGARQAQPRSRRGRIVRGPGLVWVTQEGSAPAKSPWAELDGLVTSAQRLVGTSEQELAANWKIVAEGFLEGYHLQALHGDTFFPIQFDNLNVIEQFGPEQPGDVFRTAAWTGCATCSRKNARPTAC